MSEMLYVNLELVGIGKDSNSTLYRQFPLKYTTKTVDEIIECCLDPKNEYNNPFTDEEKQVAQGINQKLDYAKNDSNYVLRLDSINSDQDFVPLDRSSTLESYADCLYPINLNSGNSGSGFEIYIDGTSTGGNSLENILKKK